MIELHCPKCGKLFVPAPQHMYKDHRGFYCSWTCYNHKDDGTRPQSRSVEQYTTSGRVVGIYKSAVEAAESINGTANGVRTACRECMAYKGYLWRYKNDLP